MDLVDANRHKGEGARRGAAAEGDRYEIIVQDDGDYRLAVNGEVVGCFVWKPHQLASCVRMLRLLAGEKGAVGRLGSLAAAS